MLEWQRVRSGSLTTHGELWTVTASQEVRVCPNLNIFYSLLWFVWCGNSINKTNAWSSEIPIYYYSISKFDICMIIANDRWVFWVHVLSLLSVNVFTVNFLDLSSVCQNILVQQSYISIFHKSNMHSFVPQFVATLGGKKKRHWNLLI